MTALGVREAYRLWAPTYAAETAISSIDAALVGELTPDLSTARLLDAGCGEGRRLRDTGAARTVGVDLSPEMLQAGVGLDIDRPGLRTLQGDVRALPLPDRAFDVVWCRLVVGHLREIEQAYAELGRVVDHGGLVVVTDFHPEAQAAGHRRSFRANGQVHEIEHYVHTLQSHLAAAGAVGLRLDALREGCVGPDVREFYERADRLAQYREHVGLPVVLALAFRREG
ncbi:class I SAM-dependent methyltransferase [Caulobacter sp. S45]|uniref:class I SAM-dependent methyltransferase n=1 Tax=Caulobacter sp. S45 TaxID=1641861 RepID=UPI00131AA363|nr:class I SAM-dependent methyltransferase [Caulobacter sp. S45]